MEAPTKYKAWEHQKELKKKDIPSREEIRMMAQSLPNDRLKALFVILYLTAARITEVVKVLKVGNIVKTEYAERKLILITIPNRKNRERTQKQIPIPIEKERDLLELMLPYVNSFTTLDTVLFPFSDRRAYQLLSKYLDLNPHWIRHIRLTHLVTIHDLNEALLNRFAGWTDGRPAKNYLELRWKDILQKY